jgi:GNAT superfamily N-acetyltransferase
MPTTLPRNFAEDDLAATDLKGETITIMTKSALVTFKDPAAYAARIVPFLERNEAENGLFIGVLDLLKLDPEVMPPLMVEIRRGDETIAAAYYRDRLLIVTRDLEDAADDLATLLKADRIDVPGVVGPSVSAEAFARAWVAIRGCESTLGMDQGLYSMKELNWPPPVPGKMRVMVSDDIPLIATWVLGFQNEATPHEAGGLNDARKNAEARASKKMTFIWECDGRPVAMAALSRPTRHGIAVNAVYTPPEFRRRGYATALVAHISYEGLSRGKEFCCLYTDLSNPTSNSIYQKIGYTLVSYSRNVNFRYSMSRRDTRLDK